MQIYLARNNQQAGPYTLEQVNQMLASQQVLLTDLAWHEGMSEWRALGELTQGKFVYEPAGYSPVQSQSVSNNPTIQNTRVQAKSSPTELATIGSRLLAKVIDLLLWLPIPFLLTLYFTQEERTRFTQLNENFTQVLMDSQASSSLAQNLQLQIIDMIPQQAWVTTAIYIVVMLIIQAVLLSRNGQSIGKKLTNIQIVDANTSEKVNLTRVFLLRSVLVILLTLTVLPFIAIIDALFGLGQKRQTLHDMIARTKVIKRTR